jgi:hypothetical protein
MTLNELVESVSRLRGWNPVTDQGVLSLSIPQAGNRKQLVAVAEFKDEGQAMLRFTTAIGKADVLDPARMRSALELNLRLPHGCLAVDGNRLVMTATRPLKTSTPETTGDALEFMARQADTYEKLIFKTDVH